jgi:histidinol-phosphate aminotransferase
MEKDMTSQSEGVHGGFDYRELEFLGLCAEDILDFSVNSNPYGPSPRVREALMAVAIERYPDRSCLELRRTLLRTALSSTRVPFDALVCGNGTIELIWAIARAYLHPGQKAALLGPTFEEYRLATQAAGATIIEYRAPAETGFAYNETAVISWISQEQPVLVWLCNPNNPTGIWISPTELTHLVMVCQQIQAVLVIDEAYWHFLFPHETFSALDVLSSSQGAPLIVLRSLTKDMALAGLRLGYAVASSEAVARRISAHLPAWNVNAFAQQAGIAALNDYTFLLTTLTRLARERQACWQALQDAQFQVLPSRTSFFLLAVGDAAAVRQQLLMRHLLVRDCTSFGLPQYIRIATRPKADWQRLLQALREVL